MSPSLANEAQELLESARRAMAAAHAPYSGFRVGVALEAADGRTFTGCNVENASHPVGMCAERVALGKAVSEGARSFRRLAIFTESEDPTPPCGMCRQALTEFADDLAVHSGTSGGARATWSLTALLPDRFAPALDARGERR